VALTELLGAQALSVIKINTKLTMALHKTDENS